MKLAAGVQELLVTILCYDQTNASLASVLVPPDSYDPFYKDVAKAAVDYYRRYDKVPGEHTLDLFDTLKSRHPDDSKVYERIRESLELSREDLNADYVMDQAGRFARFQAMRRGLSTAMDELNKDNVDEAANALHASLQFSDKHFNSGTFLHTPESLKFMDEEESDNFLTGVPVFDAGDIGPARGTLHVFVALPNRGKTWWLINLGKRALLQGKRVLHVTLEMSEKRIAQRYYQACFAMSKREQESRRMVIVEEGKKKRDRLGDDVKKIGDGYGLDEQVRKDIRTFQHDGMSHVLKKQKFFRSRQRLLIKQFPTGKLTTRELEAYLDTIAHSDGFIPDLLIMDYIDIMSIDSSTRREALGDAYVQLRGLAVERNIAVATASQANRSAEGVKLITRQHIAEDFSKIATADVIITYTQSRAERQLKLARLYVDKAREDQNSQVVLITQDYTTGQFVLDSALMRERAYMDMVSEMTDTMDEDDDDS